MISSEFEYTIFYRTPEGNRSLDSSGAGERGRANGGPNGGGERVQPALDERRQPVLVGCAAKAGVVATSFEPRQSLLRKHSADFSIMAAKADCPPRPPYFFFIRESVLPSVGSPHSQHPSVRYGVSDVPVSHRLDSPCLIPRPVMAPGWQNGPTDIFQAFKSCRSPWNLFRSRFPDPWLLDPPRLV
jgi:hypothetical protein